MDSAVLSLTTMQETRRSIAHLNNTCYGPLHPGYITFKASARLI